LDWIIEKWHKRAGTGTRGYYENGRSLEEPEDSFRFFLWQQKLQYLELIDESNGSILKEIPPVTAASKANTEFISISETNENFVF
jgi:hypothetical protein